MSGQMEGKSRLCRVRERKSTMGTLFSLKSDQRLLSHLRSLFVRSDSRSPATAFHRKKLQLSFTLCVSCVLCLVYVALSVSVDSICLLFKRTNMTYVCKEPKVDRFVYVIGVESSRGSQEKTCSILPRCCVSVFVSVDCVCLLSKRTNMSYVM